MNLIKGMHKYLAMSSSSSSVLSTVLRPYQSDLSSSLFPEKQTDQQFSLRQLSTRLLTITSTSLSQPQLGPQARRITTWINMGAGFSLYHHGSAPSPPSPGLGDLPEGCVAVVLAYLDPPEICKLAGLNRAIRGASLADCVWETKLPSNYPTLVQKVLGDLPENLGKREIYAMLCRANNFDGGTKKVWLNNTGGVCLSISAKGLAITGIDDRRYWNYVSTEESRFHTVAYLQQIWWFEADGEFEFPFPTGTYSLFFRLQLGRASKRFGRRICHSEDVHGWDIKPVRFQLWTSDGQYSASQCFLQEPGKWVLYQAGEFVVTKPNSSTKIKFSMTQIDCTHTKGGLCLDSVLVYPSKF